MTTLTFNLEPKNTQELQLQKTISHLAANKKHNLTDLVDLIRAAIKAAGLQICIQGTPVHGYELARHSSTRGTWQRELTPWALIHA